jgi:hypothetical protein
MVQDTSLSPEMYLAKLTSEKCGGWGIVDISPQTDDENAINYDDLRECSVLWAVSVPGETAWYKGIRDGSVAAVQGA